MRIGEPCSERLVAGIDQTTYFYLSNVVGDFDDAGFAGGGLAQIEPAVGARLAHGRKARFGDKLGRQRDSIGMGFGPPVWLQPDDTLELDSDGLGFQRQAIAGPR